MDTPKIRGYPVGQRGFLRLLCSEDEHSQHQSWIAFSRQSLASA